MLLGRQLSQNIYSPWALILSGSGSTLRKHRAAGRWIFFEREVRSKTAQAVQLTHIVVVMFLTEVCGFGTCCSLRTFSFSHTGVSTFILFLLFLHSDWSVFLWGGSKINCQLPVGGSAVEDSLWATNSAVHKSRGKRKTPVQILENGEFVLTYSLNIYTNVHTKQCASVRVERAQWGLEGSNTILQT